jgi:hypothetical protein
MAGRHLPGLWRASRHLLAVAGHDVSALDRGLQYTRPGDGLLAALIAAILAALSGAIARNRDL